MWREGAKKFFIEDVFESYKLERYCFVGGNYPFDGIVWKGQGEVFPMYAGFASLSQVIPNMALVSGPRCMT